MTVGLGIVHETYLDGIPFFDFERLRVRKRFSVDSVDCIAVLRFRIQIQYIFKRILLIQREVHLSVLSVCSGK